MNKDKFRTNYMDCMSVMRKNDIQLREGFTPATVRATVEVCCWLWANGYTFFTEARTKSLSGWPKGCRADILVPDLLESQVIEIVDSEDAESLRNKKEYYDSLGLSMFAIKVGCVREGIGLVVILNGIKEPKYI